MKKLNGKLSCVFAVFVMVNDACGMQGNQEASSNAAAATASVPLYITPTYSTPVRDRGQRQSNISRISRHYITEQEVRMVVSPFAVQPLYKNVPILFDPVAKQFYREMNCKQHNMESEAIANQIDLLEELIRQMEENQRKSEDLAVAMDLKPAYRGNISKLAQALEKESFVQLKTIIDENIRANASMYDFFCSRVDRKSDLSAAYIAKMKPCMGIALKVLEEEHKLLLEQAAKKEERIAFIQRISQLLYPDTSEEKLKQIGQEAADEQAKEKTEEVVVIEKKEGSLGRTLGRQNTGGRVKGNAKVRNNRKFV